MALKIWLALPTSAVPLISAAVSVNVPETPMPTGLGLHIVYNIVTNRMGGRLDLDSEPGRGTRVSMILPRVAPLEQAAE